MITEKLTKERIEADFALSGTDLDRDGGATVWDTFPGFGITLAPASPGSAADNGTEERCKRFFVEVEVTGEAHRVSIGDYGAITIEQARELAKMIIAWVELGEDVDALREVANRVIHELVECPYRNKIRFREMVVESLIKVKQLPTGPPG